MLPIGRVVVGMHRESRRSQVLFERAIGLVVDAHAPLLLHHLPLGLEIRLVHIQAAHAVRLEPQHPLQIIAGERLEEIRRVVAGFRVVKTADRFDDSGVLVGAHVRGALEHQVFEQMRESRAARGARPSTPRGTTLAN